MELKIDTNLLEQDIADLGHFRFVNQYAHKGPLLKLISENNNEIFDTLEGAFKYVDDLKVIQRGAKHEHPVYWKDAIECRNIGKNVACTHALKYDYWSFGLQDGYNIFGFQLFAIAYFLYQKGYQDLQWYIPDEEFELQSDEDGFFDRGIRSYYANGSSINNEINSENLKQRQIDIGTQRLENYVKPIKIALGDYMEKLGCVIDHN